MVLKSQFATSRKVEEQRRSMGEKTELMTVDNIQNRVYFIRGQQVMLDCDLAEIYGYEVKRLNEQVKNNISRFPEDFMFQLEKEELPEAFLKSQIVTLNESGNKRGLHIKKLPYAFTEQGIYMLATVLRGELAEQQSIFIMRAFCEMRHYIKQNQQFVTQSEMRLMTARVSEISVQMAGLADRQKKTEQDVQNIQKSIDTINGNLSRSRKKEAPAKQAFTFSGAMPTKSKVRSTADAKRLDFGGWCKNNYEFVEG